jgi:hypothetical protein
VLQVELPESIGETLAAGGYICLSDLGGYICLSDLDDYAKLRAALERMLERLVAADISP